MNKIALLLIILVVIGCNTSKKANVNTPERSPNIIFILADDLGYGDVSSYNENSKITTVNIDKLASEGVMFTDAHTSSAVCTPTRYGILTGRYNWRSTLKKGVLGGYSKALITPNRTTIGKFLKNEGYRTAYIGKWHLGWDWTFVDKDSMDQAKLNAKPKIDYSIPVKNGPNTRGFDYSYGFNGSLDMAPYVWVENAKATMVPTKVTQNTGQAMWRKGPTSNDFDHEQVLPDITKKTVSFINGHAKNNQPFFVYMPLPAPHTPILPTEEFKGKSGLENPYGDFVIMVDWVVGEIMKSLEEQGIADNTLLIFTSDNGCSNQADYEQLATKGHDPSYIFRGHKADIFEGGHRVPYVVRWPSKVKPSKSNQLVCTTDLFATVADMLNVPLKNNFAEDSYSFLSALGIKSSLPKRESIVHHSINGSFAYRKGDYKAIFCPGSGGWSFPRPNDKAINSLPKFQLYNLGNDIGEEHNLQDKQPELLELYRKELSQIVSNGRSTEGEKQKNDGPEMWPELSWMNDEE
ncbi:sulfatase family protein [Flavivirga jejuensis]|uniref:Arylsulfatase n=1 Tax=Flavivirga jejuensis TaxID=870487 RepID=A0ABT8WLE6_9FLAO|nr:arylsulfatase [Flavivirga jejuensis]MDO5973809.1 arylsulfatase [Flavivirga jejuensis]